MRNTLRRAALLGAMCAFGPALILLGWYYAHHHTVPLPWPRIALVSCLLAPASGALFATLIHTAIRLTNRPILSGIVGGSLAAILPGVFAVAVFGSYRGPYAGSLEVSVMTIAACAALAIVLTVDAGASSLRSALGIVVGAAAITAVIVLGVVYVVAPQLYADNGIFVVTRGLAKTHGAIAIGGLLGVVCGSIVGLHLGLCMAIARARS